MAFAVSPRHPRAAVIGSAAAGGHRQPGCSRNRATVLSPSSALAVRCFSTTDSASGMLRRGCRIAPRPRRVPRHAGASTAPLAADAGSNRRCIATLSSALVINVRHFSAADYGCSRPAAGDRILFYLPGGRLANVMGRTWMVARRSSSPHSAGSEFAAGYEDLAEFVWRSQEIGKRRQS